MISTHKPIQTQQATSVRFYTAREQQIEKSEQKKKFAKTRTKKPFGHYTHSNQLPHANICSTHSFSVSLPFSLFGSFFFYFVVLFRSDLTGTQPIAWQRYDAIASQWLTRIDENISIFKRRNSTAATTTPCANTHTVSHSIRRAFVHRARLQNGTERI